MTLASLGHRSLPFGTFYGQPEVRHAGSGIDISLLNADPHRVVERHTHEDAHFVLVLDGLYASSAAGAAPVTSGRALIFNPPGTTHRDRFEARSRVVEGRFLTLSIGAELMDTAATVNVATALHHVPTIAIAERLVRECHVHSHGAGLQRASLALELLDSVCRVSMSDASSPPAWLARARELLDDRCTEDIRIADVALAAGVHPVHLARVFRRYLGCSPGVYLRQRRLARTRVLLRATRRSLTDIALSSGYVDQSHFATAFKADTAHTPSAYRKLSSRQGAQRDEGPALP